MVKLADFNRVTTLSLINKAEVKSELRPYLGMSGLGHSCDRFIWYSFRWYYADKYSARVARLFLRGHREEVEVVKTLESVGIHCYGFQEEYEHAFGHCKGHNDGYCINVPEAPKTEHLLEIKTMNDANFNVATKKGVKEAKFGYYVQMQVYMRKSKRDRALFIAVNKNDDSLYVERVRLEKTLADEKLAKAENIVMSEFPPTKIFKSTWYECKFCSAKDVCHNGAKPEVNCRTCKHSELALEGKWTCTKYDANLNVRMQRRGCFSYSLIQE